MQRVVASYNEWLLITMSGCEDQVFFLKLAYVLMSRRLGEKKGNIEINTLQIRTWDSTCRFTCIYSRQTL